MATSGAQLRALVMQANAEAEVGKSQLFAARAKLEEVREQYRRISEKLGPPVASVNHAVNQIEEAVVAVDIAIRASSDWAAVLA